MQFPYENFSAWQVGSGYELWAVENVSKNLTILANFCIRKSVKNSRNYFGFKRPLFYVLSRYMKQNPLKMRPISASCFSNESLWRTTNSVQCPALFVLIWKLWIFKFAQQNPKAPLLTHLSLYLKQLDKFTVLQRKCTRKLTSEKMPFIINIFHLNV